MTKENQIEKSLIAKLEDLKYTHRPDIRDKAALEQNFRQKFQSLNRVSLTDAEFARLRDEIITADVFTAAQALREKGKFTREDGTPLEYMLVNIRDWCKNDFEVINQLRINTDNSHHRYDVILLINGLPLVQIELKSLQISPRRAMEQIVDYKNDPGNGYLDTALELRRKQGKGDDTDPEVQQLEFDLVLFASSLIDYDYIMGLIAKSTQNGGKLRMTRAELIELIGSNANLINERDDIIPYLYTLPTDSPLQEFQIREGYEEYKAQKAADDLAAIAGAHGLQAAALQAFVDGIMSRMIFDGEQLTDLLSSLGLGWKVRREAELALMADLVPYLQKLAGGREISGLNAYE